jgi:hypothetical protein
MRFIYRILEIYIVKWGMNHINIFRACLVLSGALSVPYIAREIEKYI